MRLIDLYYRAFRAFRKHTEQNAESKKDRKAIVHSNRKEDLLSSVKYICNIDEAWVKRIEEGLVYVEKAIRKERQFIRTEGEVVLIEKVKRTSKASIEHLARHSNLITKVPKDPDATLVPGKLFVVERLSDYAVYENRFLYLLLCYLRDFIHVRIEIIRDRLTTYHSEMRINKEISMSNRSIKFNLDYGDLVKSDAYLLEAYRDNPLVARIENIHSLTLSLLSTPLMREVSKAPLIRPPIVKTNVLRMDQDFKAAVELYEYIVAYEGDGYAFEEIKSEHQPLPDDMSDELADLIDMTAFLAYMYGNNVKRNLREIYEAEEERLQEEESKKAAEEIKRLRKRVVEMGEDPAEYILALEKRNSTLEKEHTEFFFEKRKNRELKMQIAHLEKDKDYLQEIINNLRNEINDKNEAIKALNEKYISDMDLAEERHLQKIALLKEEHSQEKAVLEESRRNRISEIQAAHSEELVGLRAAFDREKEELSAQFEAKVAELNSEIEKRATENRQLRSEIEETIARYGEEIRELENKLETYEKEKRAADARYHALKYQQGLFTEEDDFTFREKFKELELERKAFKKFFREQWKKTKSRIRERVREENLSKAEADLESGDES
jgi:hypothetical protein